MAEIRSRPIPRPRFSSPLRPVPTGAVVRSIWTTPRLAVRQAIRGDAARVVIAVAWFSGVVDVLQNAALGRSFAPHWGPFVLLLALVLGPLFGLAYFGVAGALLAGSGRLLGGTADSSDTRVALACSVVPELIALPLWIPVIGFYGLEIFTKEQGARPAGLVAFLGLQAMLLAWAWALRVVTLAEAHGFSLLRAFLTIALTWLATVVLIGGAILGFAALLDTAGAKA